MTLQDLLNEIAKSDQDALRRTLVDTAKTGARPIVSWGLGCDNYPDIGDTVELLLFHHADEHAK